MVLLSYLWALAACDTALGTNTTQSLAKSVVNNAIESRVPGVPVAPVTDCVIESASGSEIVDIANDGADGKVSEERNREGREEGIVREVEGETKRETEVELER